MHAKTKIRTVAGKGERLWVRDVISRRAGNLNSRVVAGSGEMQNCRCNDNCRGRDESGSVRLGPTWCLEPRCNMTQHLERFRFRTNRSHLSDERGLHYGGQGRLRQTQ